MAIQPYKPRGDVAPYYPAVVDIETDRRDGHEIAVTFGLPADAGDDRQTRIFGSWGEFWAYYVPLVKADKNARLRRLYAHNGGNFDWPHLIVWLLDNGYKPERIRVILAGGFILGIDVRIRKDLCIHLRDSYRLMPDSLAKLTKDFDVAHKKLDIDNALHHELAETDPERFRTYCAHDVLGLQEVIFAFWTMIYELVGSIDELPMTLPALAMRLWRRELGDPVATPWNKRLKALERRAYTGGRTECFRVGKTDDATVYDVNSLYPAVMRELEVPASYRGGFTREYHPGRIGIYEIEYQQTNHNTKPVLRDETTNSFSYAGSGVFTSIEIELLREVGGTFRVIDGYVFLRKRNLFRDFCNKWYGIRLEAIRNGNSGLAYVCKILMNSLYGKFGQQEEGWTLYLMPQAEVRQRLIRGEKIKDMGEFVMLWESRHNETTFVSIAAYITAAARVALYRHMQEAERRGGFVWYCDTDSVHVSGAELPTSDQLGELKEEYRGPAAYAGKKLYTLPGIRKVKHKGVSKSAGITPELMTALVDGDIPAINATFDVLPSTREMLSGNAVPAVSFTRTRTLRVTGATDH